MLRRLYDWTLRMADHPQALWVLALVSFVESSVFPIPPDVLMIPMILARPSRAWLIALVALISSVLGGLLGYAIGAFAYEQIGQPILESLGKGDAMGEFSQRFNDFGFWAVLTAGITPFPYKVITIMSGWTGMPLATFVATSILARGLRFFSGRRAAVEIWHPGARLHRATPGAGHNRVCRVALRRLLPDQIPMIPNRQILIVLAAGGSVALLLGAFAFQHLGGMAPCKLCLWQRWPHAAAIVIAVFALAVPGRAFPLLGMVAALCTAGIGLYHTGVERGWWEGPSSCTSSGTGGLSADELFEQIMAAPLVRCDEVPWEMLGLSMASWNAVAACGFALLWVLAARARV